MQSHSMAFAAFQVCEAASAKATNLQPNFRRAPCRSAQSLISPVLVQYSSAETGLPSCVMYNHTDNAQARACALRHPSQVQDTCGRQAARQGPQQAARARLPGALHECLDTSHKKKTEASTRKSHTETKDTKHALSRRVLQHQQGHSTQPPPLKTPSCLGSTGWQWPGL